MALTYDEYLGELSVSLGDQALARMSASASSLTRAVLSAGTVSAHWLLSDDPDADGAAGPVLSQLMRVRYAAGDAIDRDAIEWVIGICAVLLTLSYVPQQERDATIAEVAVVLDLGASLHEAATEISKASSEEAGALPESAAPQIERARRLILEGCSVADPDVLDPFMLHILIGKFRSFFESEVAR